MAAARGDDHPALQDTWARLLRVKARAEVLNPKLIEYAPAVEALAAKRLNARPDAEAAWQAECTVTALRPDPSRSRPRAASPTPSTLAPAPASDAATSGWRPFHVRGRAESMRPAGCAAAAADHPGPPGPAGSSAGNGQTGVSEDPADALAWAGWS